MRKKKGRNMETLGQGDNHAQVDGSNYRSSPSSDGSDTTVRSRRMVDHCVSMGDDDCNRFGSSVGRSVAVLKTKGGIIVEILGSNQKFVNRPWVLGGLTVIFTALVVWSAITDRISWWALLAGCIGFGVAVAYTQGYKLFGQRTLLVLVIWVLLLSLVSCSSNYTAAPGPGIPPVLIGARFVHEGEDMECGIGLTEDGIAGIVTVFAPPVGFVAWLAWSVTDGDGTRADLADCWNTSQANWREFELMTQCWGQPVVTTTWTDPGAATQWVKMPFCQCNQACQREAMLSAAGWQQVQNWCRQALNWFFCFGLGPDSMASAPEGPTTLPPDVPLPPGFDPPAWDTSAIPPQHPVDCSQPDCSDVLN